MTTKRESAISRRDAPESCMKASAREGVGNAGCRCTRSLACEIKQAHEHSHYRSTGFTRRSHTQWF